MHARRPTRRGRVEARDAYCKCSYTEIVKTIPYDEFKEINSELSDDPGPLPPEMLEIRDAVHRRETSGSALS